MMPDLPMILHYMDDQQGSGQLYEDKLSLDISEEQWIMKLSQGADIREVYHIIQFV